MLKALVSSDLSVGHSSLIDFHDGCELVFAAKRSTLVHGLVSCQSSLAGAGPLPTFRGEFECL